jgi:5-hydroxyisourate hydrolase
MIGLTTHVLDAVHGAGAAGVRVDLFGADGDAPRFIKTVHTRENGRAELLDENELRPGRYELVFHAAAYFRRRGVMLEEPCFLDEIPIAFGVDDPRRHYHVPLIASPWTYSTYRGGLPPRGE